MNQFPPAAGQTAETGGACVIPPRVYEIAFGWDPTLERDRFLALAGERPVTAALELGCGAGRLVAAMAERVARVAGVELSPAMAALATARLAERGLGDRCRIEVGDMSRLAFDGEFDLVYSSANTIRHVIEDDAVHRMWSGVARALRPGGAAVIDLELGVDYEKARVGSPAVWTLAADGEEVRTTWAVVSPPSSATHRASIRWTFEHTPSDGPRQTYAQEFELRAMNAADLVELVRKAGLEFDRFYEPRDPSLLPIDVGHAVGRCLAVIRKPE